VPWWFLRGEGKELALVGFRFVGCLILRGEGTKVSLAKRNFLATSGKLTSVR